MIDLARWERWLAYHVPDSRRVTSPGFPDLVLLRSPDLVFAELKSEKGRLTPAQEKWLEELGKVQHIHTSTYQYLATFRLGQMKRLKKGARKAEAGEPGMAYSRITAYDAIAAGILSQQEVEDAEDTLPKAVFRELYMNEPAGDTGCPFDHAAIERYIAEMSNQPPVLWAWDVARGKKAGAGWTVGVALDEFGCVCRLERFQKPWKDTLATIETDRRAYVDATGVGDPIAERLQQYSPLIEPFLFTATSK